MRRAVYYCNNNIPSLPKLIDLAALDKNVVHADVSPLGDRYLLPMHQGERHNVAGASELLTDRSTTYSFGVKVGSDMV